MPKDPVVQYHTMTESTALAASVSYFMNIERSCVGLCGSERKTQYVRSFRLTPGISSSVVGVLPSEEARDISHRAKMREISLSKFP